MAAGILMYETARQKTMAAGIQEYETDCCLKRKQKKRGYRRNGGVRIWFKKWRDSRMLRDFVVCDEEEDTRTHKIFRALEQACYEFDLSSPIWLDANITEFKRHAKTRFSSDNFVDSIDFDYLEMQVIEE